MSSRAPQQGSSAIEGSSDRAVLAMALVERLAGEIGSRRPTSADERQAAEMLRDVLRDHGVGAELEPFRGYPTFGLPFGVVLGTAGAPALLPRRFRRTRLLLAALAAAVLASEGSLTRTPLSDALSRWPSQNLVATIEPLGCVKRTVCVMAHVDTSRSGLLFHPRLVGWMSRWISLNSVLVMAAPVLELLAARRALARRTLGVARMVLGAGFGLILEREVRGQEVPGADDNASGASVAATLAGEPTGEPLASTRVVLCITGCEEAGTLGARALLRSRDTSGWLFVNFDNVGSGGTLRYLRREGVITHWDADPELIDVAAAVAARRPDLRIAPEDRPAGLTYDASPVLAAGGRALTFSIQDGSIPNLHWPTDTVANLDPAGVGRALEAGREMLVAIDAGAADGGPA